MGLEFSFHSIVQRSGWAFLNLINDLFCGGIFRRYPGSLSRIKDLPQTFEAFSGMRT